MIQIPNNKKLVNMLTVLTVAGEMPLVAASQAGSHEGYRKLFYELSKKQVFINTKTNEQMRVKLIHMSGRGDKRRCRLYKNAIPILDWIGTRAYLKNKVNRSGWKYYGVWEGWDGKKRLHFHALIYIPDGTMLGGACKGKEI